MSAVPGHVIADKPEARHRPPDLKRKWQIMMLIKASKPKTSLLAEGTYPATISSIKGLPEGQPPKKVVVGFKPDGEEAEVNKELPASLDEGKPLRKDVETVLGRQFTSSEAQAGYDITKLIGKRCRVVVMHKSGAGGKPQAAVSLILAETETA